MLITGLFLINLNAGALCAAGQSTTTIYHSPIDHFAPGSRILIKADVADGKGIKQVRCYFKPQGAADYFFVEMNAVSDEYQGVLPAMSEAVNHLDYLFLAVNTEDEVVKSQAFRATKSSDDKHAWTGSPKADVTVMTEIENAVLPEVFTDSVILDIVESAGRFGIVAGIYDGTVSSAASISGGGLSTKALIIGGVAIAGGAGIAAAAGSGGGSDGGDANVDNPNGSIDLRGTWVMTGGYTHCSNSVTANVTYAYSNGRYSQVVTGNEQHHDCSVTAYDSSHNGTSPAATDIYLTENGIGQLYDAVYGPQHTATIFNNNKFQIDSHDQSDGSREQYTLQR